MKKTKSNTREKKIDRENKSNAKLKAKTKNNEITEKIKKIS